MEQDDWHEIVIGLQIIKIWLKIRFFLEKLLELNRRGIVFWYSTPWCEILCLWLYLCIYDPVPLTFIKFILNNNFDIWPERTLYYSWRWYIIDMFKLKMNHSMWTFLVFYCYGCCFLPENLSSGWSICRLNIWAKFSHRK